MTIDVVVERVVLDGVPVGEARRLRRALERELARLLVEGGLSSELGSSVALPSVRGGRIAVERTSQSEQFGQRVAAAVYSGMGVEHGQKLRRSTNR